MAALDLLVSMVALTTGVMARAVWKGRLSWGQAAVRSVVGMAIGWLLFQSLWGWHYQSMVLEARLGTAAAEERRVRVEATDPRPRLVVAHAVARLNGLHASAHRQPWPPPDAAPPALAAAVSAAAAELGVAWQPRFPAPRATWFDRYFTWAGIAGLINPFGLEVVLHRRLLDVERPFVLAHEWAHLAGFADEADASFVGWMAGVRLGGQQEYAAWLGVLPHLVGAVPGTERQALLAGLEDGPRHDLRAIAARARERWPAVQDVAWRLYDGFLHANRVPDGVARYDAVTRLVLMAGDEQTGRLRPGLSLSPRPALER